MKTLLGTAHGQSDPFAPTHWSVIVAAGKSQAAPEAAKDALAQLCETYWAPLYTLSDRRGYSLHDAQDLTQGFFAYLIENKIYTRVDQQKGRFSSSPLASLKNFLTDARDREHALKRGGGQEFLPLNEEQIGAAESLFKLTRAPMNPGMKRSCSNGVGPKHSRQPGWSECRQAIKLKARRDSSRS